MLFGPTEKKISNWEEKGSTKKILDVLEHPSVAIRLAAVQALGRMGAFETKEAILLRTNDKENTVKCAALSALEKFPFADVVAVLQKHQQSSVTCECAERTLSNIASYLSRNIEKNISFMMKLELPDVSPHSIMKERIELLVAIGEPAKPKVLEALEEEQDLDQLVAAAVLGRLRSTEALEMLITQLGYASEEIEDQILSSLKQYGDVIVEPLLHFLSEGRDYDDLKKICKFLSAFSEQTKVHLISLVKQSRLAYENLAKVFIEEWKWEPESEEEKVLFSFIYGTQDYMQYPEVSGPWLINNYTSQDWVIRNEAIQKMTSLKYAKVMPTIIKALDDNELDVVVSACRAIAKLKPEAAKEKLVELVQDDKPVLRKEAAKILRAVGEKNWSDGIKGTLADYDALLANHSQKALDQLIMNLESSEFEERMEAAQIIVKRAKMDPVFFKCYWTKLHHLITSQRDNSHSDETEYRSSDCDHHSDYHSDNGIGLPFPKKEDMDF